MITRYSAGKLALPFLTASLVCGMLANLGCDQSQTVASAARKAKAPAFVDWQPAPLELPKATVVEWTEDEKQQVKPGAIWPGDGSEVGPIRFDLAAETAIVALADGVCHVLDPKSGESRQHWSALNQSKPVGMELTLDGKRVVLQYEDDPHLYVHELADGKLVCKVNPPKSKISAFAVAADPRLLAIGDTNGAIEIWNIESNKRLDEAMMPNLDARVTAIAFSNDCRELYVAQAKTTKISVFDLPGLDHKALIERTFGVPVKLIPSWSGNWLFAACHNGLADIIALRPIDGMQTQMHQSLASGPIRRGTLQNCFHLQNLNFVCSYLGGTAFDYYDPFLMPSGSADDESAGQDVVEVALARDGTIAASGFQDGSVRFYVMPGPIKSLRARNVDQGQRLNACLRAENYDELDELANAAMTQVEPDVARLSPATILLGWLTTLSDSKEATYQARLAMLQKWLDAKPKSRAAHFVLAEMIKDYAWSLRGMDVAARTDPQGMLAFQQELLKADKLLQAADEMGPPSAPLCSTWATVSMGLGKSRDEIIKLWERGIQHSPNHAELHKSVGYALLPRWMGEDGDTAKLANRARTELPGESGILAYGAIAEMYLRMETAASIVNAGFSPDELENAAQKVTAAFPRCEGANNFAAVIACMRQDHAAAASRFLAVAGAIHDRMWRPYPLIEKFRDWSQRKHVPTDSEFSFLGAWSHLSQIAFAADGTELITFGADSFQQIRFWDIANRKLIRAAPIPPGMSPLSMSDRGNIFACATDDAQRRIVLLDWANKEMITWPDATLPHRSRISADELQFAIFGQDPQVAIYDLKKITEEPAHLLALDAGVNAVEFPNCQQGWSIVASESSGRMRLLSAEGTDLIAPVQLGRDVHRLKAVSDSPLVLAGGPGLLAMLNVNTGTVVKFVDEPSGDSDPFNYTALAMTRDGKLAAAARAESDAQKVERPYEIEIWDLAQNRKLRTLAGHEAAIHTMSFSADGQRLASGDMLGFVQIWNLNSAQDGAGRD